MAAQRIKHASNKRCFHKERSRVTDKEIGRERAHLNTVRYSQGRDLARLPDREKNKRKKLKKKTLKCKKKKKK